MDFIIDAIVEWLKGLLVDGIMGNLDGLFDNVNQSVGEIATQVGTTPADWNAGVFSMIRQISETAILPIAGVILTFVMTYELIQMLIERNNLHEVDTWMFFKWVFKTFVAVMILTNTFNIVLAVFDVSQHVIQQSAGIILNVPLEEFEEFKSHSLSVRTPSGRKMDLKQAPVRGLGTPNGGIVVFDKTSGEAMNIMPKSSAHVTLRCQDE